MVSEATRSGSEVAVMDVLHCFALVSGFNMSRCWPRKWLPL